MFSPTMSGNIRVVEIDEALIHVGHVSQPKFRLGRQSDDDFACEFDFGLSTDRRNQKL